MTHTAMIEFIAIPIFSSNYVWGIVNKNLSEIYLVDPGAAEPVLSALSDANLKLKGILVTHSHPDHIGGINVIIKALPATVYGPKTDRIPQANSHVVEGEQITLWKGVHAEVIAVPGHLPEHIAYLVTSSEVESPALFCGDALFSSGCGRMFEGTPEEFHGSIEKLMNLPDDTGVFCAHEYTLANLDFAEHIEPQSVALKQKRKESDQKLKIQGRTLPSNISNERETNPFMRCHKQAVKDRVKELTGVFPETDIDTFAALRALKDNF